MSQLSLIDVTASSCESTQSTITSKPIDFSWSLKPFNIFVRVLTGVDLVPSTRLSSLWLKWFTGVHICVSFFVNLIVNAIWFFDLINTIIPMNANKTPEFLLEENDTALSFNELAKEALDILNSNVYYLSLHLYFLYITRWSSKWSNFWSFMQTIQNECNFNKELFWECRRSVLFVFFGIFVVSFRTYYTYYYHLLKLE